MKDSRTTNGVQTGGGSKTKGGFIFFIEGYIVGQLYAYGMIQ